MINPKGLENMDLNNWPHQFTRDGKEVQIREDKVPGSNNIKIPVYAIPMICVHCHIKYIQSKDPVPQGPCPARNGHQELKRILNA